MKRFGLFFIPCLVAALAGCVAGKPQQPPEAGHPASTYEQAGTFAQILEFLHQHYGDESKAGYDRLFEAALRGMMRELDPYSGYEPPAEFAANEESRTGEQSGIGIDAVKVKNAPVLITAVLPGGPADKAGVLPGEQIFRIDGRTVETLPLEECMNLLRGRAGSELELELLASDGQSSRRVKLQRENIVLSSVPPEAAHLIDGDIGYLRISSFNAHTPGEVENALKKLRAEGMSRGLVIDLRNNPGGLVEGAAKTASLLLPEGSVLFSAKHRDSQENEIVRSTAGELREETIPLVILANGYTASAAELFAGALRDHNRAKIVGMKSFGKGTLLRILPLENGGALRYAAGRYLTPSGRAIEGNGLEPDVPVELELPEQWKLTAQLMRAPGVVQPEWKGAVKDAQLEAALKLLPGRNDAPEESTQQPDALRAPCPQITRFHT